MAWPVPRPCARPQTRPTATATPQPRHTATHAPSEPELFPVVCRAVDRLEHAVHQHLIRRGLIRRFFANDRQEVRDLGAITLEERALTRRGSRRRHVDRTSVEVL